MLAVNKRYRVYLFGPGEKPLFGAISEGLPQPYGSGYRFFDKDGLEVVVSGNVAIKEDTEQKK